MPADYYGQIKPASWSLGLDILSRENPVDRQSKQLVLRTHRPLGKSIYPLSDLSLGLTSGDGSFPWWHQPFSHTPFPQATRDTCVGNRDPTKERLSLCNFALAASKAAEIWECKSYNYIASAFHLLPKLIYERIVPFKKLCLQSWFTFLFSERGYSIHMKGRLNQVKTQRCCIKGATGSKSFYVSCLNTEYQSILLGNPSSYKYWGTTKNINNNREISFSYRPRINSGFL